MFCAQQSKGVLTRISKITRMPESSLLFTLDNNFHGHLNFVILTFFFVWFFCLFFPVVFIRAASQPTRLHHELHYSATRGKVFSIFYFLLGF